MKVTHRSLWPWLLLVVISLGSGRAAWQALSGNSTAGVFSEVSWIGLAPLFAVLGVVIMSKQPGNRIGQLLLLIGSGLASEVIIGGVLDIINGGALDLTVQPVNLTPLLFARLWVNNWSWVAAIFPIFLLLYLFPTGKLPSPRWMWAPRVMIVMVTIMLGGSAFSSQIGPFNEAWFVPNPVGFIPLNAINRILIPWSASLFVLAAGGVVAMVLRYRRASSVERNQIKLVLLGVAFFGVVYGISVMFSSWESQSWFAGILLSIATAGIPASISIAILKYQLFDIDVIIRRSLTYGALAAFIGVVYIGIVVGLGESIGQRGNVGLSIAATSVVALAFQPMRLRVERLANRLVYGQRATPYEVLAQFSRRSAEESDSELLDRIPHLIVDGTGALEASLWVRSDGGFRVASSWPNDISRYSLQSSAEFVDPEADYSLPVFHDRELLGGISLKKARGDAISPIDEEMLSNLAGGLGLALRNSALTSQLRQKVKDLTRSRDRIVSAADQARRSLERDLDSGPQQHLVAVKVRLGPTRLLAQQAGAEKTAALLADIEAQAGDAIQAVRDFAAGIYPPLLGAEGLGVALGQQARRAALPVLVDAEGIGRYPRDIEAAVYFAVLEALQNTAKYATANSAEVTLRESNGNLTFQVRDDGQGFDESLVQPGAGLNGIADRIDTVGGSWWIYSSPGEGTVVSGSVPVKDRAGV